MFHLAYHWLHPTSSTCILQPTSADVRCCCHSPSTQHYVVLLHKAVRHIERTSNIRVASSWFAYLRGKAFLLIASICLSSSHYNPDITFITCQDAHRPNLCCLQKTLPSLPSDAYRTKSMRARVAMPHYMLIWYSTLWGKFCEVRCVEFDASKGGKVRRSLNLGFCFNRS